MFDVMLAGGNGCRVADVPARSAIRDLAAKPPPARPEACEPV